MDQKKREEIISNMIMINNQASDLEHDNDLNIKKKITYYADFEFKGTGLAAKDVYVREIVQDERDQENESDVNQEDSNSSVIYEIYSSERKLIATVREDGIIYFEQEYLEQLKDIDKDFFKRLKLDNVKFKLPKERTVDDLEMTEEELKEREKGNTNKKNKNIEKEEKDVEKETEEDKKEETAQALGIDTKDIKSICTINPREKITDKHNLIDLMPEAGEYEEISIVYSSQTQKGSGYFTILGVKKDGTREQLSSIESIEGATTNKDVISINEDGTEVKEKQVKGLFRINSRSRDDGISVSVGDYGMMDVDYVSNVMDKENRRATPIRTKDAQNQRIATAKVRENAGDSKEEVRKEGKIFRKREEDISTQSVDGIDIDRADGNSMTLKELKEQIKEKVLNMGEMSREETTEVIQTELYESGFELSEQEVEQATQEIQRDVLDESRFPRRDRI